MQPDSKVLVVTGMHRSGTSMLAGFLQNAGVFIGEELLGANITNQKGHFEDVDFLHLHENALADLGEDKAGWTAKRFEKLPDSALPEVARVIEKNQVHALWGWKDPRTCLFLNFWSKRLPESNYVFIFRPPWEVADSLFRRGDKAFTANPELAFAVWENYNRQILAFCRENPHRTIIVSIDDVVATPAALIAQINRRFGLNLKQTAPLDHDQSLLNKRAKQHQRFVKEFLPSVYDAWLELERASFRGGGVDFEQAIALPEPTKDAYFRDWLAMGKTYETLNHWKVWQRKTLQECMRLQEELDNLRRQLFATQTKVNHAEFRLTAISNSKVWRIRNHCAALLGRPPV